MNDINTALEKTLGFGTKEFIEKAIEGMWREQCRLVDIGPIAGAQFAYFASFGGDQADAENTTEWEIPIAEVLLDHDAWRAVGVTENVVCIYPEKGEHDALCCNEVQKQWAKNNMHRFIDALAKQPSGISK